MTTPAPHTSATIVPHGMVDEVLSGDVLAHLEAQLVSARQLLQVVLAQGAAIRSRDVHTVVATTGLMQAELQRRQLIEQDRMRLLERVGLRFSIDPGAVTLTMLERLMPATAGQTARNRSGELRGMLEEIKREHTVNRVLMSQELAFLDHLMRLVDGDSQVGYSSTGDRKRTSAAKLANRHRVLDLEV